MAERPLWTPSPELAPVISTTRSASCSSMLAVVGAAASSDSVMNGIVDLN